MAFICCPNCKTEHEVDNDFIENGARKVRCASCRQTWLVENFEQLEAPEIVFVPELKDKEGRLASSDFLSSSGDFLSIALNPKKNDVNSNDNSTQGGGHTAFFPHADLDRIVQPNSTHGVEPPEALKDTDDYARDFEEWEALDKPSKAVASAPSKSSRSSSLANAPRPKVIKFAFLSHLFQKRSFSFFPKNLRATPLPFVITSFIFILTLILMREEVIRFFPKSAVFFSVFGIKEPTQTLVISDLRSRVIMDGQVETLEVVGMITNPGRAIAKIPGFKLSVRNKNGAEVYVWTTPTENSELAASEKIHFRRRLASPPADSYAVSVTFVSQDDIASAIH